MDTEKISDWNIDPEDTELSLEDIEEVFQDTAAEEAAEENPEPEDTDAEDPGSADDMEESAETEDGMVPGSGKIGRKKKKKKAWTVIAIILAVFAVIIAGGILAINMILDKIRRPDPSTMSVLSPSEIAADESRYWASMNGQETDEPDSSAEPTVPLDEPEETTEPVEERLFRMAFQADAYRATLSADDEQIIFDHPVSYAWATANPLKDEDLINIMLVGQDTRIAETRERSDSMILVSINPKTHRVSMISFLRDLYVPIGGDYGWNRLNVGYKIGGFPFMYELFEKLYGIHIDGGICVNFGQFMTAVDILGGVDVTLNETEAKALITTLEQSVPEMRYWGMIVESKMPTIKEGTTVEKAIEALEEAELSYAYSDMNGGAEPDDISKAKVKSLWIDETCETAAKAGKYYSTGQTIYITYEESKAVFPKLAEDLSVASAETQLKQSGFTVAYANKNGGAAPQDPKATLVDMVTTDAEGKTVPEFGTKFKMDTVLYITYTENLANIPIMADGISVKDAEPLLKAAGLKLSWTNQNGGIEPYDKAKAVLTGIYRDQEGTKSLKAGDKLDINATVYLSYKENMAVMPVLESGISVKDAKAQLEQAGFTVAYAEPNSGAAPRDEASAVLKKVSSDAAGTKTVSAGKRFALNTVLYLTYEEEAESTDEPQTEPVTEPSTEPQTEPSSEPVTEPSTEPQTEPSTEPQTEPSTEPVTEPQTEPSTEVPTSSETEATIATEESSESITPSLAETEPEGSDPESNTDAAAATKRKAIRMVYNPILTSSKTTTEENVPEYLQGIKEGKVHLNGMQTLAYCRMRKLDSDFMRTTRQRQVLNTLFTKVKTSDMATLRKLLDELLPTVITDMTNAQIMSVAAQVLPYFSSMQINSYTVPASGTWRNATIDGRAVIQSDQEANIEYIISWLPF